MEAKPLIDKFFSELDYERLSRSVCAGYAGCAELMKDNIALGNFLTGIPQWSHLVRTYVEHAVANSEIVNMTYEFRPNAANNCWHARYFKGGVTWTTHFVGGGVNKRSNARKAINRAELSSRNLELFPDDSGIPDISPTMGYFQLLHAGYEKSPESITIAIPSRDQRYIVAGSSLPIIQPTVAEIEEVEEAMVFHILDIQKHQGNEGA